MKKHLNPIYSPLALLVLSLFISACHRTTSTQDTDVDTTQYVLAQETGPGHDEAQTLAPVEADYNNKHYVVSVSIAPSDSLPMVKDDFGDPYQDNTVSVNITSNGQTIVDCQFTKADFIGAAIASDHASDMILGGIAFDKVDASGIHLGAMLSRPCDVEGGVAFRLTFPHQGGTPSIVRDTTNELDDAYDQQAE